MLKTQTSDPMATFLQWLDEAKACDQIPMAKVMTLATVDEHGAPAARMVLLKDCDERGLTFYTNLGSAKAQHLQRHPKAALCFYWGPLNRQVRISGDVERVDDQEADACFAGRPRLSQIGAWASRQSQPLGGRWELERRIARYTARFHVGQVPRPTFWSGFRVIPRQIEFWSNRPGRLHERVVYTCEAEGWRCENLYP